MHQYTTSPSGARCYWPLDDLVVYLLDHAKPDGDCLICHYTDSARGYCQVHWRRPGTPESKKYPVHRLVCEAFHGPPTENAETCHSCHRKNCINPEHLRWGTKSDNMYDYSKRGRDHHHFRKLTEDQVREMRGLRDSGWLYRELAERFGVNLWAARFVCIRKAYPWVE